jgi:glycosyltransferase involved in cell wall biosynthesis
MHATAIFSNSQLLHRAPDETGAMTAQPRVLVIAEACNPEWTSVPLVGFCHCEALRQVARILVITHSRNGPALTRAGWVEGKDFEVIDTEWIASPIWKMATWLRGGTNAGWTTLSALTIPLYYLFEHLLWQRYAARLKHREFDVVHRLIPLSPALPSLLAGKCRAVNVPFIVGPLNGGLPWPKGFKKLQMQEREWLSSLRGFHQLLPGYRSMRRDAAAILVASRETLRQMPRNCRKRCFYVPENGIDPTRFRTKPRPSRTNDDAQPLKAVFVGRMVPLKGVDMLLNAAAPLLKAGLMTLDLVGDGPELPRLKILAERLGIVAGLQMSGWIEHQQVQAHLANADVLTFPSIREFGGGVVLEAMALGVVPIVVDFGGPAELVTADTGYVIPLRSRAQLVRDLHRQLEYLLDHPAEISAKSAAAQERAWSIFRWEHKARQVRSIYDSVLGRCDTIADRPELNGHP